MNDEPDANEMAESVVAVVGPLIASAAVGALVNEAMSAIAKLTATNQHHSDPTGDHDILPTKRETVLQKNETTGTSTKQSMANDDVSAQKGTVGAAQTDAKANISEATASEAGATAVRTKAGASDIETKGLKMM